MNDDTVSYRKLASGGTHEQIESFLQTVMRGLGQDNQEGAGEKLGKPGHPVSRPSHEFVDGSLGGRSARLQVNPSRLALIGGWWLVEPAVL